MSKKILCILVIAILAIGAFAYAYTEDVFVDENKEYNKTNNDLSNLVNKSIDKVNAEYGDNDTINDVESNPSKFNASSNYTTDSTEFSTSLLTITNELNDKYSGNKDYEKVYDLTSIHNSKIISKKDKIDAYHKFDEIIAKVTADI